MSVVFLCLCHFYIQPYVTVAVCPPGTEGLLLWNDNWVSFLDTMLQMQIISTSGRELRLPTRIRSLRIDPLGHEKFISTLEDGTKGIWYTVE